MDKCRRTLKAAKKEAAKKAVLPRQERPQRLMRDDSPAPKKRKQSPYQGLRLPRCKKDKEGPTPMEQLERRTEKLEQRLAELETMVRP